MAVVGAAEVEIVVIEGYVHVEGAAAGTQVTVAIPDLKATTTATVDADRAAISLPVKSLTLWSPDTPRLYKVELSSGTDKLTDEMGFRTSKPAATRSSSTASPFPPRHLHPRRSALPHRPRLLPKRR